MNSREVIEELKNLIADRQSFIYQGGDNAGFEREIEALEYAIKTIEEIKECIHK